ncbi:Superoxide dismutase, copper/zinc binding domain containing protein [Hyaloscypha variabilis]
MFAKTLLVAMGGMALASPQDYPPTTVPVSTLSTVESGVLPYLPTQTPFTGLETIEGAIVYDGPVVEGFTGPGGNASIQNNNPAATYVAILPSTNFDNATGSLITGSITGAANPNGTGVLFTVNFAGFPSDTLYGPFVYHVHNLPVSSDGNCTATMGHLDPTDRGEYHPCENIAPETCQAGDLAGKHGNITGTTFQVSYEELYLSTTPGSPYFFGDKSVVIHSSNTTRLTCANFTLVATNSTSTTGTGTTGTASATPSSYTGAAVREAVPGIFVAVGAVLGSLML